MIKINANVVEVGHFPDQTQHIVFSDTVNETNNIMWAYENDEELFTLMCCVDYIRRNAVQPVINLYLPYVPNARMDRIKENNENFSLKVFANFINSLHFNSVQVKNVHSNVSMALIDNVVDVGIDEDINNVLSFIGIIKKNSYLGFRSLRMDYTFPYKKEEDAAKDFIIFFPDEGACKRYSELDIIKRFDIPVAFGIKKRDWKTGKIEGYDVVGDVEGKNILIIDDICSAGGTFYFAGKKLKELGANNIDLYITHCENNIVNGKLLGEDSPIRTIYTTDSILNIKNNKIKIISLI